MHAHTHTHTHARTHARTHAHTNAHTHAHTLTTVGCCWVKYGCRMCAFDLLTVLKLDGFAFGSVVSGAFRITAGEY